jgi:uncharacterized protein (DUF433 family)
MSGKLNPTERKRLKQIVVSDPEIMGGTPVFRGTRIPVDLIADMLAQRTSAEEILDGYPTLDRERIAMAPLCARAFPVRKSGNRNPWSGKKPQAERSFRLSELFRSGGPQDNDQEYSV